jgi:hypothetical protein
LKYKKRRVKKMKKYDVFKSQGGYGVALGIYLDSPVVGSIRWFAEKADAEEYAKNKKRYDEEYAKWEEKIKHMSMEDAEKINPPNEDDYNLNVGIYI